MKGQASVRARRGANFGITGLLRWARPAACVLIAIQLTFSTAFAAGHHVTKHPLPGLPSTISNAAVYNVYWSLHWDLDSPAVTQSQIDTMTQQLLGSSYLGSARQYGVIGASLGGSYQDFHNRINCTPRYTTSTSQAGIIAYLGCNIANPQHHLPRPNGHLVYVLYLPPKTDIAGNSGCHKYAGYHSAFPTVIWGTALYIVVQLKCNTTLNAIADTLSHEIAETTTDPVGAGWYEGSINLTFTLTGEVGDLCETAVPAMYYLNGMTVSTYWSNADNTCVAGNAGGLAVQRFSVSITGTNATVSATILNNGSFGYSAPLVGFQGGGRGIVFSKGGFPSRSNVTIPAGQTYTYSGSNTFTAIGTSCYAMSIGHPAGTLTSWTYLPGWSQMPGVCFTLNALKQLTQSPWHP